MVGLIGQQSAGYCSEENLEYLESADQPERKIEGFLATAKQKHGKYRQSA
jgi:hypothetical protein